MRFAAAFCAMAAVLLAAPVLATADTLGTTTLPAGASPHSCPSGTLIAENMSVAPSSTIVPASGGKITQWQVNTAVGATPGSGLMLVVLAPTSATTYTVRAVDSETVPTPLPASGIASFTPPAPIAVSAGDQLGLYGTSGAIDCYWQGGATPAGDGLIVVATSGLPAAGQSLSDTGSPSGGGFQLNVQATLVTAQDVAVSTSTSPAAAIPGHLALLASSVTNAGPDISPITVTDVVPAGLTVDSAVAGSGTCTTSGQQITCTISSLTAGQSAPVNIVVTPTASGNYANTVTVATADPDPNPANNTATASLTVSAPPVAPLPSCVVPTLKATPVSVATRLLVLLHCKQGKLTHAFSGSVAKGLVITTTPRAGSYQNATAVGLQVSSGRKPKKKRHHR